MPKIVIEARESGTSTGRYVDKLVEYLHRLEPQEQIIILTKNDRLEYFKLIAPNFDVIATPYRYFTFGEQLGLKKQLEALKPDLVHFSMIQQPVLYKGKKVTTMMDLTTVRFKNPSKNPIVFFVKQRVYRIVTKVVPHTSRRVIVLSQFVRDDIIKYTHAAKNKFVVTYAAADKISEKAEPVKGLAGKQFLMYVGRPLPHKNLPRLIEAHQELRKKHPELLLVLAGQKHVLHQAIEDKIQTGELAGVILTGFVSEGQLRWLYEHCAVYIFPSLSEGFGLPGLEAMMHDAPVASSNATCLPEIYGDAACYFDPKDISSMSAAINRVLTDANFRSDLIQKGRLQAKKYSWEVMARNTLDVYREVLES